MFQENIQRIRQLVAELRQQPTFAQTSEKDELRKAWDAVVVETISLVSTREEYIELKAVTRVGDKSSQQQLFSKACELGFEIFPEI